MRDPRAVHSRGTIVDNVLIYREWDAQGNLLVYDCVNLPLAVDGERLFKAFLRSLGYVLLTVFVVSLLATLIVGHA